MPLKAALYFFGTLIVGLLTFGSSEGIASQAPLANPFDARGLVDFSAVFQPDSIQPGAKTRLVVKVVLKPGWHIYSIVPSKDEDAPPPTKVEIESGSFDSDGVLRETSPKSKFMPDIGLYISYHQERAFFYKDLRLKMEQAPGKYWVVVRVHYQLCGARVCLPEEIKEIKAAYQALPLGSGLKAEVFRDTIGLPAAVPESRSLFELFSPKGWAFMALAALMGFFSLLTPCVLPMIPIAVSYFSRQSESRLKTVKLAVLFALGIIFTYSGLGVFLSAIFGADTALRLASNPWLNLSIAVVFILFALSLMGLVDFSLPSSWTNYFDQKSRYLGEIPGVLLMGFTFTLTAFTCTVQFVGTMLIAAAHGERIWPLIGMLIFSSVFAFPFFLLALIPGLIKRVQGKTGDWLAKTKIVLGILELMIVLKFLSNADLIWKTNLLSRNAAILIWMGLLLAVALYLSWGALRPRLSKSVLQWGIIAVFIGAIILLGRGWNDRPLGGAVDSILPPPRGFSFSDEKIQWLESIQEAQKAAAAENKPILIEFTGYTCINCRWMEQNILSRKDIALLLTEKFVPVRLFTDGGPQSKQNLQLQIDRFKTVALPFYVILAPNGDLVKTFSGISLNSDDFIDFLSSP